MIGKDKISIALVAVVAISGCELDRMSGSNLEVAPDGSFKFTAQANNFAPASSPKGEALRMRYLEKWLADNAMCSSGYEIDNRSQVYVGGALYNITYRGHCK